ncbi:MAG: ABC transporter substrate-binding protein [Ruminiclostridium sp.]|nr:ABC transporter substrate-binding protein [Ruminiclostridium sp.]
MKEKIYTIPVTEVFGEECECPMCLLEKRLEDEYINYFLGPSLMEPDCRMDTNEKGFCRRHFQQLYNSQENRLGLGLMIDTHLQEQICRLKKAYYQVEPGAKAMSGNPFARFFGGKTAAASGCDIAKILKLLNALECSCSICCKLDHTMERYLDVIFYLWSGEIEFKKTFESKKGFCLKHFKQLLESSEKYLKAAEVNDFLNILFNMQMENLARIQQEVNWFTRKFDYRNNDAPWGNSKDAIPRSIQKLKGYCELK